MLSVAQWWSPDSALAANSLTKLSMTENVTALLNFVGIADILQLLLTH